jgi:hypothetical protein
MNRALKLATLVYLVVRTFHSGLALAREIREAAEHEAGRVEGTDDIDLSGIPDAVLDSWRTTPPTFSPEEWERAKQAWAKACSLLAAYAKNVKEADAGRRQRAERAERREND